MIAQAWSSTASWSGARGHGRIGPDEPDLERPDVARHVVDDHVGARLGLEQQVADLDEAAVAPDLEPAGGPLEIEVGDADEDRAGDGRRCGPDGQGDDRLVLALAADRQDRDLGRDRRAVGDRGRQRAVRGDEDLRVAGARGELAGQLERVAEVARGRWSPRCRRAPGGRARGRSSR